MIKQAGVLTALAKPKGRFPHYRRAGDFVFVSGTSSRLPDDSFRGATIDHNGKTLLDIAEQTRAVLDNIELVLDAADAKLSDVVEISTFLVDMAHFPAYNHVYGTYFTEDGPARTTVAVSALPHPDILIEIKAVAYAPQKI